MNSKNKKEKRKIKVAWYENNMSFVDPILYYLEKDKIFEVKVFGAPDRAEEEIVNYQPDLVIFDYRMERFNGVQMFKKLKNRNLDFVPVFFSIWARDDATRSEIIKAGVESEAIFDKTIEPTSFSRALYEYYKDYMRKKGTK